MLWILFTCLITQDITLNVDTVRNLCVLTHCILDLILYSRNKLLLTRKVLNLGFRASIRCGRPIKSSRFFFLKHVCLNGTGLFELKRKTRCAVAVRRSCSCHLAVKVDCGTGGVSLIPSSTWILGKAFT